jgi:hypothetical protein
MISNRTPVKSLALLGALLSLAVAPTFAVADAEGELRQFIQSAPELRASFGGSTVTGLSPVRAEASATTGQSRHAVVLFKENLNGAAGQQFCHAALGGPERAAWLQQLKDMPSSDGQIAEQLAAERAVKSLMRRVEYHSVKGPAGWESGVCVVKLSDFNSTYPALPDQEMVRAATYRLGKQLFAAGQSGPALDRFKSLRLDSITYPNALLYIVAILDKENQPIADALRGGHVDLSKVSDVDALMVYAQSSAARKLLKDARAAGVRCVELKSLCYEVPIER